MNSVTYEPLSGLVSRICEGLANDPSSVDGTIMAELTKRLIAAETAPGGPYRDERGMVDEDLNRSIAELLHTLGVNLPNMSEYGNDFQTTDSSKRTIPRNNNTQTQAAAIIGTYRPPLREEAMAVYAKILKVDRMGEISRLSEWFGMSIGMAPSNFDSLGAANLMTWIAYSMYDTFLDGGGEPQTLPVANATHRDAVVLYQTSAPIAYKSLVNEAFQAMDEANAWELEHCRFKSDGNTISIGRLPDFGDHSVIADRAAAHILGPLILLRQLGVSQAQYDAARSALSNYLIARQWNDDLHDWVEDVMNGHVSPVVAYLLGAARIQPGNRSVAASLRRMQTVFWQTGLSDMSVQALTAIRAAEDELVDSGLMSYESSFIGEVLRPIEHSIKKGLDRHSDDKAFLRAYKAHAD